MVSAFQASVALRSATESARTSTNVARLPVGNIDRREKTLCEVHGWEVSYDAVGLVLANANVVTSLQVGSLSREIAWREVGHPP
jgi:hypothetical protein